MSVSRDNLLDHSLLSYARIITAQIFGGTIMQRGLFYARVLHPRITPATPHLTESSRPESDRSVLSRPLCPEMSVTDGDTEDAPNWSNLKHLPLILGA